MNEMGVKAFQEMKQSTPTESNAAINNYIRCVAQPITEAAKAATNISSWEVVVFKDDTPNAFALPGGKIGVHTGMLPIAKTSDQLAAVLGHEIGHVIAKHGSEQMSTALATQGGLAAIDAFLLGKNQNSAQEQLIMGALGLGAQVGIVLPHSRTQESEADLIGLRLMSQAGFNPQDSVVLWQNMIAAANGNAPPQWLSTHPASEDRIQHLQENMQEALGLYQQAQAAGKHPACTPPN